MPNRLVSYKRFGIVPGHKMVLFDNERVVGAWEHGLGIQLIIETTHPSGQPKEDNA